MPINGPKKYKWSIVDPVKEVKPQTAVSYGVTPYASHVQPPVSIPQEQGINRELLLRQQFQESSFNPKAVSRAGAKGLAQIMDNVKEDAIKAGVLKKNEDLFDPKVNARIQKWYMNDLYNASFISKPGQKDNIRLAKTLAAYNWGRGSFLDYLNAQKKKGIDLYNSLNWMKDLPKEPKEYVNKILLKLDPSFESEYSKAVKRYPYKKGGKYYGHRTVLSKNDSETSLGIEGNLNPTPDDPQIGFFGPNKITHTFGNSILNPYSSAQIGFFSKHKNQGTFDPLYNKMPEDDPDARTTGIAGGAAIKTGISPNIDIHKTTFVPTTKTQNVRNLSFVQGKEFNDAPKLYTNKKYVRIKPGIEAGVKKTFGKDMPIQQQSVSKKQGGTTWSIIK